MNKVFGSTDLVVKSARIVNFCCKSSGFVDFNSSGFADRGSVLARIPDCAFFA